jgi:hypothetical protein
LLASCGFHSGSARGRNGQLDVAFGDTAVYTAAGEVSQVDVVLRGQLAGAVGGVKYNPLSTS